MGSCCGCVPAPPSPSQVAMNKHLKEENHQKHRQEVTRRQEVHGIHKELNKLAKLKQMALKMLVDIEDERCALTTTHRPPPGRQAEPAPRQHEELVDDGRSLRGGDVVGLWLVGVCRWSRQGYERRRDELRNEITRLAVVEIKSKRKEIETQKVQIDEYKREKEILNKKLSTSDKSVHDIKDIIIFNESCMKVLQNEITGFQNSLKTQRDQMNSLLHEQVSPPPHDVTPPLTDQGGHASACHGTRRAG